MEIALVAITLVALAALAFAGWALTREQEEDPAARLAYEQEFENRMLKAQAEFAERQTEHLAKLTESQLRRESENNSTQMRQQKQAIDKTFENMQKELKTVREYVTSTDTQRVESVAQMTEMITQSRQTTELLRQDTQKLNEVLSGKQSRGKLGEGTAENVLRFAGLNENVDYLKQTAVSGGTVPDFTFLLADDRILNMDVKTPMEAFQRYLAASSEAEQTAAAKAFVSDTKKHINAISNRDYVNPEDGTLDYVLMLIPHEQVIGFLYEHDAEIDKYGLERNVVICSPLTLILVLNVIRQATENFRLQSKTREIFDAFGAFSKQWGMYSAQTEKVGNAINSLNRNWTDLDGTRTNQLGKAVKRVDDLRSGVDDADALPRSVDQELRKLTTGEVEVSETSETPLT